MLKRHLNKTIYRFALKERSNSMFLSPFVSWSFQVIQRERERDGGRLGSDTTIKDISMFYGVYFGFEYQIIPKISLDNC